MNETNDLIPHSGGNVVTDRGPVEVAPQESMPEPEVAREDYARENLADELSVDMDLGLGTISNDNVRGISINPLSSGYMVKVGCQSVAVVYSLKNKQIKKV